MKSRPDRRRIDSPAMLVLSPAMLAGMSNRAKKNRCAQKPDQVATATRCDELVRLNSSAGPSTVGRIGFRAKPLLRRYSICRTG
jgi:hypothetical protein